MKMSATATDKKSIWAKMRPSEFGVAGAIALLMAYFILLSVLNSFGHAIDQFFSLWYWILALTVGFGVQIGLYAHLKQAMCANAGAGAEIAATGGISAGSMLGCCLHHVTDVVPIIGLSAATLFVSQYQNAFMALGVASNLVGITMMLNIIQKHKLFNKKSAFMPLFKYDMKIIRNAVIVIAIIAVAVSFYSSYAKINGAGITAGVSELPEKTNSENAATITAKPVDFGFGTPVKFYITLTAHQGSLDYDMAKVSVLLDAEGNSYQPVSWDGSPPGGHHRSGTLTFPALRGKTGNMKLIIKGIYNVPERLFEWTLA